MSLNLHPNFRRFNALLESQTGNDYYTYTDICSSMDIMQLVHMDAPDASAQSFIKLMGLHVIPSGGDAAPDPDMIDRVANHNRYIAALDAFTMGSDWRATDSGFITKTVDDKTYRVSIAPQDKTVAIPRFVLTEAPGTLSNDFRPRQSVTMNQMKTLMYKDKNDLSCDDPTPFKEVGSGYDIGELLSDIEPAMKQELETMREAEPARYLATSAMMESINASSAKVQGKKPQEKKRDSTLSL